MPLNLSRSGAARLERNLGRQQGQEEAEPKPAKRARSPRVAAQDRSKAERATSEPQSVVGSLGGYQHRWEYRHSWNGVVVDLFVATCGLAQHGEPKQVESDEWCPTCGRVEVTVEARQEVEG